MNREQRRTAIKQAKKDNDEELADKIALFGKLPDYCLTCEKPFDKRNKEMVMSWSVIVREKEDVVHLYCPECWNKALEVTEDFRKHMEEKYGSTDDE